MDAPFPAIVAAIARWVVALRSGAQWCSSAPGAAGIALALVLTACGTFAGSMPDAAAVTPTPSTRAAQTALARGSPTPLQRFPTAVVYLDPRSSQPIWPTPPTGCNVSGTETERPDLGPTIGQSPIWIASTVLPIIPWRNEFVRSVWIVDRDADGDLTLTGRRTDGEGVVRFLRPGGERATDQLRIPTASKFGPTTGSPQAARYADHQVYLAIPSPGCWELTARLAEEVRTFTMYVYN